MKPTSNRIQFALIFAAALALLIFASGCATTGASENLLAAAGFKQITADTPKKQELLNTLPKNQLTLINWKGQSYYVQPDASATNVAWVGRPAEYQAYEQLRLAKQMSNDNLMAAQMNQDAMYRWGGAWGWGGPAFYGRWR